MRRELESWVLLRIEVSADTETPMRFGVDSVPVLLALTSDGRELGRIAGFVQPAELIRRLRSVVGR